MSSPTNNLTASRRAFLLTEVVVAAMVLSVAITVLTQIWVRTPRLQRDTRQHRIAVEEASNQLDRLAALDETARANQLVRLNLSPIAEQALPSVSISAGESNSEAGRRITVIVSWDRFGERSRVALTQWIANAGVRRPSQRQESDIP